MKWSRIVLFVMLWLCEAAVSSERADSYSPYTGMDYPMHVYWGDLHVHSSYSMDANLAGLVALTPTDAYAFAQGEPVEVMPGFTARINQPLDFLAVTDHAEILGLIGRLRAGDPALMKQAEGRRWHELLQAGVEDYRQVLNTEGFPQMDAPGVGHSAWRDVVQMAELANQPGVFTALAGFEWTATPGGNNLHRNVIFRDGPERTLQVMPFSFIDSARPEDLWQYLASYEEKTGGNVLAIPHNSNLSGGLMFGRTEPSGEPMEAATARLRARWEPVVEVTQIKGSSEAHPLLSPQDEFADYGIWDEAAIAAAKPHERWMLPYEYARSALQIGLQIWRRTGVNPYQFGMIGSSDSHVGIPAVEESNFWGKMAPQVPSAERATGFWRKTDVATVRTWEELASGYAAVWARENTREAIFDALERRQVYATTGPRMTVRFFGGWEFSSKDINRPHYALIGYRKGVPMGSNLPVRPDDVAPTFMVHVLKDPRGANLDRIQIVKGWIDADGETHEKVYSAAWSGAREVGLDGDLPAVGSTVDVDTATYLNTVGAPQLAVVWKDPDFNPDIAAFYYVRVLEIPTPRWTTYDAARFGAALPPEVPRVHQERAYTSPIWYMPAKAR